MASDDSADVLAVQRTLSRFMNCFDRKDWDGMTALLGDSVHVDYFDLRGEPPRTIEATEFVTARRTALHAIDMQHLIGNFDIDVHGDDRLMTRVVPLGSGSSGNATLVTLGSRKLLIDAGLSARELALRLAAVGVEPGSLDAILLSHEHHDHARGLQRFAVRHRVPVFSTPV